MLSYRVFSDYLYESQFFGYNKTVEDFHIAVLWSMFNQMNCRKYFTTRGCAYNSSLETFKVIWFSQNIYWAKHNEM